MLGWSILKLLWQLLLFEKRTAGRPRFSTQFRVQSSLMCRFLSCAIWLWLWCKHDRWEVHAGRKGKVVFCISPFVRFGAFSEVQVIEWKQRHGEGREGANSFVALPLKHKKRKGKRTTSACGPQEKKNSACTFATSTSVGKAGTTIITRTTTSSRIDTKQNQRDAQTMCDETYKASETYKGQTSQMERLASAV